MHQHHHDHNRAGANHRCLVVVVVSRAIENYTPLSHQPRTVPYILLASSPRETSHSGISTYSYVGIAHLVQDTGPFTGSLSPHVAVIMIVHSSYQTNLTSVKTWFQLHTIQHPFMGQRGSILFVCIWSEKVPPPLYLVTLRGDQVCDAVIIRHTTLRAWRTIQFKNRPKYVILGVGA